MAELYSAIERNKKPAGAIEIPDDFKFYYLNKQDRQMRFNNGGDPIYTLFSTKSTTDLFQKLQKILLKNLLMILSDLFLLW